MKNYEKYYEKYENIYIFMAMKIMRILKYTNSKSKRDLELKN